ncbi:hypothetical protein QFZ48_004081 [Chitinophaga sp. W2I13]
MLFSMFEDGNYSPCGSLEGKWITNEVSRDTYDRWYATINTNIRNINAAIERYSQDPNKAWKILNKNIELITDMGNAKKIPINQSQAIA